jgi:integrase
MRMKLNADIVRKLPSVDRDIYDADYPGLVLRCRASGTHTWRVLLGYGKWYTIGRADVLGPVEARGLARDALRDQSHGKDPNAEKRRRRSGCLEDFLDQHYGPWVTVNRKTGAETLARIRACFGATFGRTPLSEINAFAVERWRSHRLKQENRRPATVNRDLVCLKAALSKAVEWNLIEHHPLAKVKLAKVDRIGSLRFLSAAEEARLRKALEARDEKRRQARERANAWRRERGHRLWPALGTYTDVLTPLVFVALETGLRFGELAGLRWSDVDVDRAMLTVQAAGTKTGTTRYVPLNSEAVKVLKAWKPKNTEPDAFVFPGRKAGTRLTDVKTAWAEVLPPAKIRHFRFHDLRHTFASKLVQAGVDLNAVRELLGHADIKMTLRYAHLAPEHRAAAVAKLVAAK